VRARCLGIILVFGGAALAQDAAPKPLPERIREANARATRALAARAENLGLTGKAQPSKQGQAPPFAERTLLALALARAGGRDERAVAKDLLDRWWADARADRLGASANYELALGVSALEGLSLERLDDDQAHPTTVSRWEAAPIASDVLEKLAIATSVLLESRVVTASGKGCAWGYKVAPFPDRPRRSDPDAALPEGLRSNVFDHSNTQFSVLALHDAARAGIDIPREIAHAIGEHYATRGFEMIDEGRPLRWSYSQDGVASYPMTFGALSALAVARELGVPDRRQRTATKRGLTGMETHARALAAGPVRGLAYELYSLEKAFDLLDPGELDGTDWFSPLAENVLAAQDADGLWDGSAGYGTADSAFFVLFLARATVSRERVVDRRATRADPLPGEVFLPDGSLVDAVALVRAYAEHDSTRTRLAADGAIAALKAEGDGREACLLGPLADLLHASLGPRTQAARWLQDLAGRPLPETEAREGAATEERLEHACVMRDPAPLRSALDAGPLPLRAHAARGLATLGRKDAIGAIASAAGRLAADERLMASSAGGRTARAQADALAALLGVTLPALPARGPVAAPAFRAAIAAAHAAHVSLVEREVSEGLRAREAKDGPRSDRARARLRALGQPALERLVELAGQEEQATLAFGLLRALTGELIPDDLTAWRAFVRS
jgi:hypothetical protein